MEIKKLKGCCRTHRSEACAAYHISINAPCWACGAVAKDQGHNFIWPWLLSVQLDASIAPVIIPACSVKHRVLLADYIKANKTVPDIGTLIPTERCGYCGGTKDQFPESFPIVGPHNKVFCSADCRDRAALVPTSEDTAKYLAKLCPCGCGNTVLGYETFLRVGSELVILRTHVCIGNYVTRRGDGCLCCGKLKPRGELYALDAKMYSVGLNNLYVPAHCVCHECARKYGIRRSCSECGEHHYLWDLALLRYRMGYYMVCPECADNSFECTACRRWHFIRDRSGDTTRCVTCQPVEPNTRGMLHSYNTQPCLRTLGDGPIYYGVEIEMVSAVRREVSIQHTSKFSEGGRLFIFKSDGSLPESGAEMVTCPMSLDEHHKFWPKLFVEAGMQKMWRAWKYGECGMHVHISREMGDRAEAKIVTAINLSNNSARMDELAGRRQNHYAQRNEVRFSQANSSHYAATSGSQRYPTLEIRAFKASVNLKRILCCVEFCACITAWSQISRNGLLKSIQFSEIENFAVNARDKYPAYAGFALWGRKFFTTKKVPWNAAATVDPAVAAKFMAENQGGESETEG